MKRVVVALVALVAARARAEAPAYLPAEGAALVGTHAPEWRGLRWLQGGPLALSSLRGRAVLVRFWSDECPYCSRTLSDLEKLWERWRGRGLVVVGIHHPKEERSRDPATVRRAFEALGVRFPVAQDLEWRTLRAYGVGTTFTRFTSASFLVGRDGVIRFVHEGGTLADDGGPAWRALAGAIERALR